MLAKSICDGDRLHSLAQAKRGTCEWFAAVENNMVTHLPSSSFWLEETNIILDQWEMDSSYDWASDAMERGYYAFHASIWFKKERNFETDECQQLAANAVILDLLQSAVRPSSRGVADVRGSFCVSSASPLIWSEKALGGAGQILGNRSRALLFVPRHIRYCRDLSKNLLTKLDESYRPTCLMQMARITSPNAIIGRARQGTVYATVFI